MKYKILVLDIDGTLTNQRKEITEHTRKTILQLQKQGVKVVLASGRPTYGVIPAAKTLEMDQYEGYILSFNGGQIINCKTGSVLFERIIEPHYIEQIYDQVKYKDVAVMTYEGDTIVTETPDNYYVQKEAFINKMKIKQVEDFRAYVDFHVTKVLVAADGDYLKNVEMDMTGYFGSKLSIYRSEPFFLEIMPPNIDKATSLEKLLRQLHLTRNEMIACGDGANDISMIQYAGLGVAMENAQQNVKQCADYITRSNEEDGVAYAIEKFCFVG